VHGVLEAEYAMYRSFVIIFSSLLTLFAYIRDRQRNILVETSRDDITSVRATINQSIEIYFLSNRNITVYTVYASAQKAAREAHPH